MNDMDNKKLIAMDLLIQGTLTKGEIAKTVGIDRKTLYAWMGNDEFKAEWDKRKAAVVTEAGDLIRASLAPVVNEIIHMALSNKTESRTKFAACQYLCNRAMGTPVGAVESTESDTGATSGAEAWTVFTGALMAAKDKAKAQKRA